MGTLALLSFVTAKGIGVLGDLGRGVPEKYSNFTRQSTRFVANHIKYFYVLIYCKTCKEINKFAQYSREYTV